MAQADSGESNKELLDETAFLQELHTILKLSNSSESASLLRQYEAASFDQLISESNKLLRTARRLSRKTDTARPIFHAILDEYERWLYSSQSDLNLAAASTQTPPMQKNNRGSKPAVFSLLPPSVSRRKQSRNHGNRHQRLIKKIENSRNNNIEGAHGVDKSDVPSLIPKEDYVVLEHPVAPQDNDKYPAIFNPTSNMFEQLVFPAKHPYGNRDPFYLKKWLEKKLKSISLANEHQKDGKGIVKTSGLRDIESGLSQTIPIISTSLDELMRQCPESNRGEVEYLKSLWQTILKVMSIILKHVQECKDENKTTAERDHVEIQRFDKVIDATRLELKDAKECTDNLKSDTNVLQRALVAKEKELEKCIKKHHKNSKKLRKALSLVQKMEDEEFLKAYKEGQRIERIDGLPQVMDRLADVLMEHDVDLEEEKGEINSPDEDDDDDEGIVSDEAEEFSSMLEKHSRHDRTVWSKLESNDDDIDSVDGNLARKKKSSLHTNKPTMKVNEVLCNDIEISSELYECIATLKAEFVSLRRSIQEKLPIRLYRSTCHRETQTDELDIQKEEYLARQPDPSQDAKDSITIKKDGKDKKGKSQLRGTNNIPRALTLFTDCLPIDFVPNVMSLRVAKMHIGRIYNQYIKFFEHSNSPVVDFTDGEKTKNISLLQFAYDLYLGIEEILELAQSKICSLCVSVIKFADTDLGCHMFCRLCGLIPQVALPHESIDVFFAALSYLKNDWRKIKGDRYVKLEKAQEAVGLLCKSPIHLTNIGLKNLAVLIGIDGGLHRLEYVRFDMLMQYLVTMWEKDYCAWEKKLREKFSSILSNKSLDKCSRDEFHTFIVNACQEKDFPKSRSYAIYESIKAQIKELANDSKSDEIPVGKDLIKLEESVSVKTCMEAGVMRPNYRNILISIKRNVKKQVDDNNALPDSGDDASMFDQLIALWEENKIAIENMVTKNTKNLDAKEIGELREKYEELVEYLETKLNSKRALNLYTELLKCI